MLYRAIFTYNGRWSAMTFAYDSDAGAVGFAQRFVDTLARWFNDARLTHVVHARGQLKLPMS